MKKSNFKGGSKKKLPKKPKTAKRRPKMPKDQDIPESQWSMRPVLVGPYLKGSLTEPAKCDTLKEDAFYTQVQINEDTYYTKIQNCPDGGIGGPGDENNPIVGPKSRLASLVADDNSTLWMLLLVLLLMVIPGMVYVIGWYMGIDVP